MPECLLNERKYRRNHTLQKLKQMLCKLENTDYEKDEQLQPTVFIRRERCECKEPPPVKGKRQERANLDGGEAFPYYRVPIPNIKWMPKYLCVQQDLTNDMGCFNAVTHCKGEDKCMCCECEMAEGSHVHMPQTRDHNKSLQEQCYSADQCGGEGGGADCEPNLYPGRWFPNIEASCKYPHSCKAECFDHHDNRDWVVSKPSYTYYLQARTFKPF